MRPILQGQQNLSCGVDRSEGTKGQGGLRSEISSRFEECVLAACQRQDFVRRHALFAQSEKVFVIGLE
jgi:hypothetical protein